MVSQGFIRVQNCVGFTDWLSTIQISRSPNLSTGDTIINVQGVDMVKHHWERKQLVFIMILKYSFKTDMKYKVRTLRLLPKDLHTDNQVK